MPRRGLTGRGVRLRWQQVQVADGVIRAEAKKHEEKNAPAGAETFVADEDAVEEARPGSVLRGRNGEVIG